MNGFDSSMDIRPRPTAVSPLVPGFVASAQAPSQIEISPPSEQIAGNRAVGQEEGPNFEKLYAVAITTTVTHVLGTAPINTLLQRATATRSVAPSSPLSISLRGHLDQFKQFHRQESFSFILGSGMLDLCDGAVSGALLGVLVELSRIGWVLLTLDETEDPNKKTRTLAQRAKYLLYFGLSNAACFASAAVLCLPLHIANYQVRHHAWRGWKPGVFPLRANGFWKAVPTLSIEYQFLQIFNRRVRRYIYDLMGRPFSVPLSALREIKRQEAARRWIKGKDKLVDDEEEEEEEGNDQGNGEGNGHGGDEDSADRFVLDKDFDPHHHHQENGKGKETPQQRRGKAKNGRGSGKEAGEEEEEEEDLGDLGRELVRKAGFHLLTRGIGVGVTLLTSVVHLPLSTITNSILSSPHAYTGPIDCAQQILAAEGWQGFYKGLFWYVLANSDVLLLHDVWTGAEHSLAD